MANHNEDIQHHENNPCVVKTMDKTVNQFEAPFKQASSLACCNSIDNKGCKEAADSSDLRWFSQCITCLKASCSFSVPIVKRKSCPRSSKTRGPVTFCEASIWKAEDIQGLIMPSPPKCDGKEISYLSASLKVHLPNKAGRRCKQIDCSSEENNSLIPGRVLDKKKSISPKVHEWG